MSIGVKVFDHKTTNFTSEDYWFDGGILQVDIAGSLDGADVISWVYGVDDIPTEIRVCSWKSSDQDVLNTAGVGRDEMNKSKIFFTITNAGASTDISLSAGELVRLA